MTKDPLKDISPNYLLGDEPKLRGKGAPDEKSVKYMTDLGNVLLLNLGTGSVTPDITEASAGLTTSELRREFNLIAEGESEDSPLLQIELHNTKNVFMGEGAVSKNLLSSTGTNDDQMTVASSTGVGKVQMMLFQNKALMGKIGAKGAANLPADVELVSEDTESKKMKNETINLASPPTIGEPITIPVNPAKPTEETAWFTVLVSDPSKEPAWTYTYRVADTGQETIEVPTAWKDSKGKEAGMSMRGEKESLPVWIYVNRSQMKASALTDEGGGNLCVETSAGTLFSSSLNAAKKK
jgi:hypothetical protein